QSRLCGLWPFLFLAFNRRAIGRCDKCCRTSSAENFCTRSQAPSFAQNFSPPLLCRVALHSLHCALDRSDRKSRNEHGAGPPFPTQERNSKKSMSSNEPQSTKNSTLRRMRTSWSERHFDRCLCNGYASKAGGNHLN